MLRPTLSLMFVLLFVSAAEAQFGFYLVGAGKDLGDHYDLDCFAGVDHATVPGTWEVYDSDLDEWIGVGFDTVDEPRKKVRFYLGVSTEDPEPNDNTFYSDHEFPDGVTTFFVRFNSGPLFVFGPFEILVVEDN